MCTVKFSATVHLPCVAVTKEEFLVLSKRRYGGSKARAAIIKEKLMPALLANAILLFTAAESIENFSCHCNLPAILPTNPFPSYPLISASGSRFGSARFWRKCAELFSSISAEKVLKSCNFRTLVVAGEGFEPTTSGL